MYVSWRNQDAQNQAAQTDGGEPQKKDDKLRLQIDGQLFEVSKWVPWHPGGEVIRKWHDRDATQVFTALHGPEAWEKLKAYKYQPADLKEAAGIRAPSRNDLDLRALRKQVEDAGLMKTNWLWYVYKTVTTFAFVFAGIAATLLGHSLIGAVLIGIGLQQLGWLGHDYCHHMVFQERRYNRWMGYFSGNILQGFSQRWWADRHNTHHAITNVLDSDPDVDNVPLFAWDELELANVPQWARRFMVYQQYYFVPWTPFLRLIWCLMSIIFVATLPKHANHKYRAYYKIEAITLALHWAWYIPVMLMAESPTRFFFITQFIPGAGIALVVFLNHYSCKKYLTVADDFDFASLVCRTTRNITPGLVTDWWFGGLNYQIEHHMFPNMPRHNLSKATKYVKQYCKDHKIPYLVSDASEALTHILTQLGDVAALMAKQEAAHEEKALHAHTE
jgi:fatty acid desaturase